MQRGKYDEEYLQYLRALLKSMDEYGLVAYVVRAFVCENSPMTQS